MAHLALGQDRPAAVHRRGRCTRPPVGLDGAADRLAVDGDPGRRYLASSGNGTGRLPGGQLLIQRAGVRARQRAADRRLARHHQRAAARVAAHPQAGLACLIEELNATPPRMPGDPPPITYSLAA